MHDLARIERPHRRADRRRRDRAGRGRLAAARAARSTAPSAPRAASASAANSGDRDRCPRRPANRCWARSGCRPCPCRSRRRRLQHLGREAQPVVDRSAIFVGAEVGAVAQELVDQIAVGAVDLDAVEPGARSRCARPGHSRRRSAGCRRASPRALRRRASCPHRCGRNRARSSPKTRPAAPPPRSGWTSRPMCHSWATIRPPAR